MNHGKAEKLLSEWRLSSIAGQEQDWNVVQCIVLAFYYAAQIAEKPLYDFDFDFFKMLYPARALV